VVTTIKWWSLDHPLTTHLTTLRPPSPMVVTDHPLTTLDASRVVRGWSDVTLNVTHNVTHDRRRNDHGGHHGGQMVVRWATQNRVERCRGEGARPHRCLSRESPLRRQPHLLPCAARSSASCAAAARTPSQQYQSNRVQMGRTRSNHWHMLSREAERGAHNGEGALERCALQRRRKLRGRVEPLS